MKLRIVIPFLALFFFASGYRLSAQTSAEEVGLLPTELSGERLETMAALFPPPQLATENMKLAARHRRQFIENRPLTPLEERYREIIRNAQESGRFVHLELRDGTVHTGKVAAAGFDSFNFKDGIFGHHQFRYIELAKAPRPVAAVGTRIANGAKWTGLVIGCIAVIPAAIVFYPLVAGGVIKD